jgi:hypothetical protein
MERMDETIAKKMNIEATPMFPLNIVPILQK